MKVKESNPTPRTTQPYKSISIPARLLEEIEKLVEELGYWPTKTAFIREACLEKLERHRKELRERNPLRKRRG